jgi:hypothetical protein
MEVDSLAAVKEIAIRRNKFMGFDFGRIPAGIEKKQQRKQTACIWLARIKMSVASRLSPCEG